MSGATQEIRSTRWLLAICMGALLFAGAASADDRHGGRRHDRGDRSHWSHDRHDDRRASRYDDYRGRDWSARSYHGEYDRRDWRYYNGRYWAPPRYRGRECSDRRHYHGVHYHVAARDYYDHYYPRYRYYGPQPYGASASVIITLPLF
jgi:hypothetical protein